MYPEGGQQPSFAGVLWWHQTISGKLPKPNHSIGPSKPARTPRLKTQIVDSIKPNARGRAGSCLLPRHCHARVAAAAVFFPNSSLNVNRTGGVSFVRRVARSLKKANRTRPRTGPGVAEAFPAPLLAAGAEMSTDLPDFAGLGLAVVGRCFLLFGAAALLVRRRAGRGGVRRAAGVLLLVGERRRPGRRRRWRRRTRGRSVAGLLLWSKVSSQPCPTASVLLSTGEGGFSAASHVRWRGCKKWRIAKRRGFVPSCRPCVAAPLRP